MIAHLALVLILWAGAALVLTASTWPARPVGDARITRHLPGSHLGPAPRRAGDSLRTWQPMAEAVGDRLAHLLGVDDDLAVRLERAHDHRGRAAVRRRHVAVAALALLVAATSVTAVAAPLAPATVLVVTAPALAFWTQEQRCTARARAWQRRVFLELPAAAEQLGLLLGAGYSLGTAIGRLGGRGDGAVAHDLRRVAQRIRHGLDEHDALAEWARIAQVPAVDRLVQVLALDRQTGDLGRLIAEEARSVRLEVHREVLAEVRRRSQQVWVPVTVAALLPGAIFLAVPFLRALDVYAAR